MNITPFIERKDFARILRESKSPWVVVFATRWCGYCRRFLEVAKSSEFGGELFIVDVDSEDESLWEEYNIPLVPTIMVFKDGREVFRQDGRPNIGLLKGDLERALLSKSA